MRLEVMQFLENKVDDFVDQFLIPIETIWQPSDFLPDAQSETFFEEVKELQEIAKDLQEILGIMLADNRHAWELQPDGNYTQRCPGDNCPEANSQKTIMSMALRSAGIS